MIAKKCEVVKIEAIVRGYITGEPEAFRNPDATLLFRSQIYPVHG